MTNYTVYGSPQSLFTRKFEAAMLFYELPFDMVRKRGSDIEKEIEERAGTHQIPVMRTPENWMLADTTPMMMLLDSRVPARAMFPAGIAGLLVHLVEEYLDEWVARVMVHYRWNYPRSAETASKQIADGNDRVAEQIRSWGPRACRATGVGTPELGQAAEQEYSGILAQAERQLGETKFLMGDRPTAVDCAFLGGMRAHILNDPDPCDMMHSFPVIRQWCEKSDHWDGTGEVMPETPPTPFAVYILEEMSKSYRPFLLGNAKALETDARSFTIHTHGIEASYLARPYPKLSRQLIKDRIQHLLNDSERGQASGLLEQFELEDCF